RVMLRSRILSMRCRFSPSGNFPQCSIFGITCRRPSGQVHRRGAQLLSDRPPLESAPQVEKMLVPFVFAPGYLLQPIEPTYDWHLSVAALPCFESVLPSLPEGLRFDEQPFLLLP